MRGLRLLLLATALAACSQKPVADRQDGATPPPDLESAAIERGVIRDPSDTNLTGLYARDTDRVCIVPDGYGYRIGVFVDYGDPIVCSGSGTVTRVGEMLHVELGKDGKCSFNARFDGDKISFPGRVPDACQALCERRASVAALSVSRLSESTAEAQAMRDSKGRNLCATAK